MKKHLVALLVVGVGQTIAGQLEIKYNSIGLLIPDFAENGMEAEYSHNNFLIPFVRLSLLDRNYEDESWAGDVVGKNYESGYQIWVGNKCSPFNWRFMDRLEVLLFLRQSHTDFEHSGVGRSREFEKEKVEANSIGAGLSYNINIGRWIVFEPFWYGDYGRYNVKVVSGNKTTSSPYLYRWDDEHRVGLNVGIKI